MNKTIEEPTAAPHIMKDVLNEKIQQGWKILGLLELTYPGELAGPIKADLGLMDPSKLHVIHLQMPHGDHHHNYIYILVDPSLNLDDNGLTEKVMTALMMMEMDEQATVEAVGNA